MKIKLMLAVFLLLLPCVAAAASTGSMKLLAVSELDEGVYKGSIADLTLEIRSGDGRVFVNTFPISKLDTQISMRFAKQIACKHTGADCGKHDFIYTVEASSGIVGGPSAGAAAAVLTTSLLDSLSLRKDVAITGTINSGELIGPVGGLKEKIDVAANNGINKVLVPKGGGILEEGNETINLSEYSGELGIELIEVSTLSEALFYFTGRKTEKPKKELIVDPEYSRVMESLAVMLCNRSAELQNAYLSTKPENHINEDILGFEKAAINDTENAALAFQAGDYYTSASHCFRANIDYMYIWNYLQNFSREEIVEKSEEIKADIEEFDEEIDSKKIETLTDLQAYMVTKERLDEANDKRKTALEKINKSDDAAYWLAFANERLYSAYSWSKFFGAGGQMFELDNDALERSCEIKISEAEERYQYVNFYLPDTISQTRKEINKAMADKKEGDYIMCLFKASRAKAQANVVLSMIGVERPLLKDILLQKISAAEQTIIEQQEMGIFPIMGYSYLEYANSFAEEDIPSAIIYSEYALELGNFDFYFEKKDRKMPDLDYSLLFVLIMGICIGFLIGSRLNTKKAKKSKSKRTR